MQTMQNGLHLRDRQSSLKESLTWWLASKSSAAAKQQESRTMDELKVFCSSRRGAKFRVCESLEVTVAWSSSSSSSSLFSFESQGMRLDSSLCYALVACWRSWLPSLPGVAGGWSVPLTDPQKGSKERLQTSTTGLFFACRGLVPLGSQHASTPFLFFFMDQQRTLGRAVRVLTKCFHVCLYLESLMIRYFVSYLCHICDTFYLKAVRAQQELDMLRQARISSAYVCLWVCRHVTHSEMTDRLVRHVCCG
eukprot:g44433.t1